MTDISSLPYITYVLRLWTAVDENSRWQVHLENPRTGERHGFTTPEKLIVFLEEARNDQTHSFPNQQPKPHNS
ncbi:MAG: hypothetical protein H6662_02425 [Ardenticatenaceae bacterium]|nr:hypothetical protein [Anaerolineales bacterium]MCB8920414.1 hypothetical protein [Ardenticatenaceae bacterium]MCB8989369.1 hypothetical protein [Ardenticatenaceae bacterium]MCB9004524.1 hypothetical protein [Ardenticatenaceae bacterium]